MDERGLPHLLDLIYGAAVDPGLWVQAMEGIADTVGGNSAWLSQLNVADGSGSGLTARIDPIMPVRYVEYYSSLNPFCNVARPAEYLSRWRPKVETDSEWFEKDYLTGTEYYNDFMRPQQVHSVLMIDLAVHGLETATVNINRSVARGPFGAGEREIAAALHPHLIRAFRLSRVFSGPRAVGEAAVAALDQATDGLFILDCAGRVRHVNRAGEHIVARGRGLSLAAGRLVGSRCGVSRALDALIAKAGSPDPAIRGGGSMALPSDGGLPLCVAVAPLHAERWPMLGSGPSILVSVTDLAEEVDLSEAKLRALFALTGAEVRVVRRLLAGATPGQAAETLGVSVTTVRSQLASIFAKTGAAGQAELSRLMMRVAQGPVD